MIRRFYPGISSKITAFAILALYTDVMCIVGKTWLKLRKYDHRTYNEEKKYFHKEDGERNRVKNPVKLVVWEERKELDGLHRGSYATLTERRSN